MHRILAVFILVTVLTAQSGDAEPHQNNQQQKYNHATLNGHLVDVSCTVKHANETKNNKNWVKDHDRQCLVNADSAKSGYAVFTVEKSAYRFDDAGNRIAKKLIADTQKEIDWKVTVTGLVEHDIIKVSDLVLEK